MFEQMNALRSKRPLRQGDSPLPLQAENAMRALTVHPSFANGAPFPDEITSASWLSVGRGWAAALHGTWDSETLCLDHVLGRGGEPVLCARSWFHPRVRFREGGAVKLPLYDIIAKTSALNGRYYAAPQDV